MDNHFEVKLNLSVRCNVPGNGSPPLFHPRGKPFMFQLDTHGWTEVRVDDQFVSGSSGWEFLN